MSSFLPLSITQDCISLWTNPFKWVQMKHVSYPMIPILAHTKVSVYLTEFRNAQFRSVTLRKCISWNLAPEEKIILFPPGQDPILGHQLVGNTVVKVQIRPHIIWNWLQELTICGAGAQLWWALFGFRSRTINMMGAWKLESSRGFFFVF